jgi:hypothetical protein
MAHEIGDRLDGGRARMHVARDNHPHLKRAKKEGESENTQSEMNDMNKAPQSKRQHFEGDSGPIETAVGGCEVSGWMRS